MKTPKSLVLALLLAGCGAATPPADMPARSWRYYTAHPDEIAPMQAICRQWSGSSLPVSEVPAVVVTNCSAAAFAKSMLAQRRTPAG